MYALYNGLTVRSPKVNRVKKQQGLGEHFVALCLTIQFESTKYHNHVTHSSSMTGHLYRYAYKSGIKDNF